MNEVVSKIIKMFDKYLVLSILESPNNYIVSICDKDADLDSITDSLYAIDKKTSNVSEFSYFSKPEEYSKALQNVLYKYDDTESPTDELTHWGIKGMRWGIRRYQNKDGSLTPAGKRRLKAESDALKKEEQVLKNRKATQAKFDKLEARRRALEAEKRGVDGKQKNGNKKTEPEDTPAKKTLKDLSDDELRAITTRMQLEANYHHAQKSLAALNPKPVSKGKQFVDSMMNDVVVPAAKNAGRAWLENFMKDKLGLNKADPIAKLEKKVRAAKLTKELEDLKENANVNWENQLKRQSYEQNQRRAELNDIQYQIALYDAQKALKKRQDEEGDD